MTRQKPRRIGLAIVGGGRIGTFRGQIAGQHPQVDWIGVAEVRPERLAQCGADIGADFVTTDFKELLARGEVTAVIIATGESQHVQPTLEAVERGHSILIEKPLATDIAESEEVLARITSTGVDAVVGYSQRFRRRWLTVKDRIASGAIGEVSLVTSRSFMNRLVPLSKFAGSEDSTALTPMMVAGTHPLDLMMWFMAGNAVKRVYGRSVDKVFGRTHKGIDATMALIEMVDGSAANITVAWSLPTSWPGAVDSLHIGVIGTEGVFTVDDSHSDVIMAVNEGRAEGYAPDSTRRVDFLGGYLAGDVALGQLRGPLREETVEWLNRLSLGVPTHHATVIEAHDRLMLTKAIDLSAHLGRPVELPLDAISERRQRAR